MASQTEGGGAPRTPMMSNESVPLSLVFDEVQRRVQEMLGGLAGEKKQDA